jgi:hypothetical protein
MFYKILHSYTYQDYTTLVVEKVESIDRLVCFGEFSMNLLNSKEIGLHPILDQEFIKNIISTEVFFTEIKNEYYNLILENLGHSKADGMYIHVLSN